MEMDIEILVANKVEAEIERMDIATIIEHHVRSMIQKELGKTLIGVCEDKAKAMIEEEIERVLDGTVETDDGWGKKNQYDSFTSMFRMIVKKQMDSSWDVKRTIGKLVENRCASLIKQDYNKICEKITDEITKSKLIKK